MTIVKSYLFEWYEDLITSSYERKSTLRLSLHEIELALHTSSSSLRFDVTAIYDWLDISVCVVINYHNKLLTERSELPHD